MAIITSGQHPATVVAWNKQAQWLWPQNNSFSWLYFCARKKGFCFVFFKKAALTTYWHSAKLSIWAHDYRESHTASLLSPAPLPSPVTTRPHLYSPLCSLLAPAPCRPLASILHQLGSVYCLFHTEHPPSLPKSGTEQFLHSRAGLPESEGAKRTIASHQWAPLTSRCPAVEPHKKPQQKTRSGACCANT